MTQKHKKRKGTELRPKKQKKNKKTEKAEHGALEGQPPMGKGNTLMNNGTKIKNRTNPDG